MLRLQREGLPSLENLGDSLEQTKENEMTQEATEARARATETLRDILQSYNNANGTLSQGFLDAYKAYEARRDDLRSRWSETVEQLRREYPLTAAKLCEEFPFGEATKGVYGHSGVVFTYTQKTPKAGDDGVPELSSSSHLSDDESLGPAPSASASGTSLVSKLTPLPKSTSRKLNNTSTHHGRNIRPPKLRLLETEQGKIKTSDVGNCWIFEYHSISSYGYYIMMCPDPDCQSRVFSKNPLREGRGIEHLRQHGHPVKDRDEEDMIVRYAQAVDTEKWNYHKSRSWIRKHNNSLLATNEAHLLEEDFCMRCQSHYIQ